jgi:uncharacterized membrane protein
MAFCSKCGSVVADGAAFCSVCGFPTASAGAPAAPPVPAGTASIGISSNVAAALSYFFITGIIFLLMEQFKNDKFVRFHSFQAIAYWVVITIFWTVWNRVLFGGVLPLGFFWTLIALLNTLISLAIFAFWLFLMYKAYNNDNFKIPFIGEWAFKQAYK